MDWYQSMFCFLKQAERAWSCRQSERGLADGGSEKLIMDDMS
jgi:hypothetical protein